VRGPPGWHPRAVAGALAAPEGKAAGEDLSLGFPAPFTNGSGSNLDEYEADIRKDVAKTYAALDERLKNTAGLAEKQGVGFTWWLTPPVECFAYESSPTGGSFDTSTPLRIDAACGGGKLDQNGESTLVVSGTCNGDGGGGDVTLDLQGTDLADVTAGVGIDEDTGRWSAAVAVSEGNDTIVVNQAGRGSFTGRSAEIQTCIQPTNSRTDDADPHRDDFTRRASAGRAPSYSSCRRHQGPVGSLRPLGARSSHGYMPQSASRPRE